MTALRTAISPRPTGRPTPTPSAGARCPGARSRSSSTALRGITNTQADREVVFETLRDIGYMKVEPFTDYGMGYEALGDMLKDYRLKPTSMHNGDTNPESAVEKSLALGVTYTNFPYAAFDTLDGWRGLVDTLNPVGEAMAAAGIQYGYHNHNHDREFTVVEDGVQAYDVLLEGLDDSIHMQLDLYWVVAGGADPVEVFSRDPGRFLQFHVKDRAPDGSFADPGEGTIDFPRIFAERKLSGVREYITENDAPADALEFAETGFDYLRNVRY